MKRICSLLLVLVIGILLIGMLPIQANADELENGLRYKVYNDHVEITYYTGDAAEVVIPAEIDGLPVTVIGKLAFQSPNLISVSIPDSVTTIVDWAFYWCDNLTSIYIPDSVTSIGESAFYICYNLNEILVDDNNPNYSNDDRGVLFDKAKTKLILAPGAISGSYTIPDGVTSIGDCAFHHCTSLVTVNIPDTLASIGATAFYYCSSLNGIYVDDNSPFYSSDVRGVLFDKAKTILVLAPATITDYVIPDSVTSIGNSAFYLCRSLTSIDFPDSLTSIGDDAFYYCSSLTSIDLPDGVTYIGEHAFESCEGLTSIDLPDSLTSISDYTFRYCDNLTSIDIPGSVASIGQSAFVSCSSLTNVSISYGVTSIATKAFESCTNLTTINIPDSVTSIDSHAFWGCYDLTSIYIPDSVASIGYSAFTICNALTGIHVDENNPNYSSDDRGVLFDKAKTELIQAPGAISGSYAVPDSVTSIGSNAFYWCDNLTSIYIPDSVTSIGHSAFEFCRNLTSIDLPVSVTSIGHSAFEECSKLTHIIFRGDAPQFGFGVFNDVTATAYYVIGNTTWTEDVLQDYGGEITWVAFDPLHTHEYTATITDPTCDEQGFTTYTCSCGDSYVDDYVDALSHDYSNSVCPRCGRINDDLQYTVYEDHVEITGYTGNAARIVIPAEIGGVPVTVIGRSAFQSCTSLTSIDIPDTVTSIGYQAFYNCTSLSRIIFMGNAPYFDTAVFYDVVAIAYYPPNNTTWTDDVMQDYAGTIVWSSDAPSLPHNFNETITPSTNCTTIGYTTYTCSDCGYAFERYNINPSGHYYQNGVCTRCGWVDIGFRYVCYPDHVEITKYTSSATKAVIPAEIEGLPVTALGISVFHDRYDLTSVTLPDTITSIGPYAFTNCHSLTNVNIPDSVTSIETGAFWWCVSLPSISIPDGVTIIEDTTFYACQFLNTIDIPDNVTSIGATAFYFCTNLRTIDIPDSVTSIGDRAFAACENLTNIMFKGDAPQFGKDVFEHVTATACYPADNPTWTEDVMQDYGGNITWLPYIPNPFTDVPAGSFYEEPVLWALENDITTGLSPTSFAPDDQCIRAQVVTFLWRAEGTPAPNSAVNPYSDVPPGSYFYNPVLWAVENKITTGLSAAHFGSNEVCTRGQVVTFLWRAAGCPEPGSTDDPFADVSPTDYYYKPVLWALESGITTGLSPNHFGAAAPCNRAQVVTFLYRAYT